MVIDTSSWLTRIDARALANEGVTFKSLIDKVGKLFGPRSEVGMGRVSAIQSLARTWTSASQNSERREAAQNT